MAKRIVLCVALVAMVCGFSAVITIAGEKGPETVVFENKKGDVTFQHYEHQAKFECADCHHTKADDGSQGPYVAGEEGKCASCHELGSMRDEIHQNCRGCHKEQDRKLASCSTCHVK